MGELTADNPVARETLARDAIAGGAVEDDVAGNAADDAAVAAVRGFNRFYTNVIGLLRGKYLDTPYSLTEARLLFELAQRDTSEVPDLRRTVDIDPGYLSRILARFASDGLIARQRSAADARRQVIRLTDTGRAVVAGLDARSAEQTRGMLAGLRDEDRHRLLDAMRVITETLTESPRPRGYLLRAPRPGDMGWVVQRNAAVYAEEFGWDGSYEALVARIVADYVDNRDPDAEAAWIAEVDGARPAACSACARTPPPRGCGFCWWSRGPGASGSAPGWSRRCSVSPAKPGTRRSRCGPTTCSPTPGAFTSGPASPWTTRTATTVSART